MSVRFVQGYMSGEESTLPLRLTTIMENALNDIISVWVGGGAYFYEHQESNLYYI